MATPDLSIKISANLDEVSAAILKLRAELRGLDGEARKAGKGSGVGALGKEAEAAAGATKPLADGMKKTGTEAAGAKKEVEKLGAAVKKAGDDGGSGKLAQSFDDATASIRRFVTAAAAIAGAVKLVTIADEMATLDARLRIATGSAEEYNRAQVALFDLSQRSRASLTSTVDLYQRIALATKESGVGQETLLGVVETINQAVALSGASATAAQAALVQLGQGLASGTLRGEELNSILEQTPVLADAIAKGMGITRGELKKYGEEGKISSQQVIEALQRQGKTISDQFAQLPLTVGQSITLVANAFRKIVSEFNNTTAATKGIADTIKGLADFLGSDRFLSSVTGWASVVSQSVAALAKDFAIAADFINAETNNIIDSGENMGQVLGRAFYELPLNLRASVQILANQTFAIFDRVISYTKLVGDNARNFFDGAGRDAAFARFQARNAAAQTNANIGTEEALAERERALSEAKRIRDAAQASRVSGRAPGTGTGTGRPGRGAAGKGDNFTGPIVDSFALTRDAAADAIKQLEALYRVAGVSLQEYLDRRQTLQTQAIDAEIAQEQRKLAEAIKGRKQDEASRAATAVERLRVERGNIARDRGQEERQLAQALADERIRLDITRLEQQGRLEEAALQRLQLQYRDTLARLTAEGDEAGVELVNRIINTDAARARFADLRTQFERVQSELSRSLQSTADQRTAGTLSFGEGETRNAEARRAATADLQRLNEELRILAERSNDPQIIAGFNASTEALARLRRDGLSGIDLALNSLRGSLDNAQRNFASNIATAGFQSLQDFFKNIASGSVSAGDAIRGFFANFAQQVAAAAAQIVALQATIAVLNAISPGLGSSFGKLFATTKHAGGRAEVGPQRAVPSWVFAGAPRLHSGLKADEFPAILQTGEEVLSRGDPKNSANGGGAGGGVRVVNVVDPNLVDDYMSSASGERTIVNTITRNRGQIKQLLG